MSLNYSPKLRSRISWLLPEVKGQESQQNQAKRQALAEWVKAGNLAAPSGCGIRVRRLASC